MIASSRSGRRRQANGQRIGKGSIANYRACRRLLYACEEKTGIHWQLFAILKTSQALHRRIQQHWERFYRSYTDFLFARAYLDNYVANQLKVIRTLLHWLQKEFGWIDGQFLPYRWVQPEQIPIITLSPAQLNFLIHNKPFEQSLSPTLQRIKDIFVIGCITALRFSDLLHLKKQNLQTENGQCCLTVTSHKTHRVTCMVLPQYSLAILSKYKYEKDRLLPAISNTNFNIQVKKLMEKAGWVGLIGKTRRRKGDAFLLHRFGKPSQLHRFCDLITSHTMRRTAISTLLLLGLPEYLVKQLSGHSPNSREFFRYVNISKQWQDEQTSKAHEKLEGIGHLSGNLANPS